MTHRLGRHQRKIIARLRAGAILTCDGGKWAWEWDGRGGRLEAWSCVPLLARGLIYERGRDGERVVYGLSVKGEMVE